MGSFSSRPKVPQVQPQVIFVPQPTQTTFVPTPTTDKDTPPTAEESAAEARRLSLLSRSRGRFGTVQTSFRGLLGTSDSGSSERKSLLGE